VRSHPWHDVPLPSDFAARFQVFIEIPRGSHVKYKLDKATGLLKYRRVLPRGIRYPANYGFLPRTYCEDGDPLDAFVLGQEPMAPAVLLWARAIGLMRLHEEQGRDDKIIAVHIDDPEYAPCRDIADLPQRPLRELQLFFLDYEVLEEKKVRVETPLGREAAIPILREAIALYARERERLFPASRERTDH
jgi:inorganic pyrophosphatase